MKKYTKSSGLEFLAKKQIIQKQFEEIGLSLARANEDYCSKAMELQRAQGVLDDARERKEMLV